MCIYEGMNSIMKCNMLCYVPWMKYIIDHAVNQEIYAFLGHVALP